MPANDDAVNPMREIRRGNIQEQAKNESMPRRVMDVVEYIQRLIEDGALQPGDKLPTEREFAKRLKTSRESVRIGRGYLAGMGVVEVRRGVGTFLADGASTWRRSSYFLMSAIHGAGRQQMPEAQLILESAAAALAAQRAKEEHIRKLTEEVAEMYAAMDSAEQFQVHEMNFHRVVAEATGNSVLAASMDAIATEAFTNFSNPVQTELQRRNMADIYRQLYKAIRQRRPDQAQRCMAACCRHEVPPVAVKHGMPGVAG